MQKFLRPLGFFSWGLILAGCASDSIEDLLPACDQKTITVEATTVNQPGCSNTGVIRISASGSEGFSYSIDGVTYQTSPEFTGLGASTFTVFAQDDEGCTGSSTFSLESTEGLTMNVTVESTACGEENGGLLAEVTGGTGVFEYSIDGTTFQSEANFASLASGEYELTARDSEGCTTSQMVNVTTTVSLAVDIMPIISTNCAISGCHGNSRSPLLNTPEQIIGSAARIRARALGLDAGRQPMPPSGLISQELQDQIDCWVNDGALNN